jgi:hypothetical protein
VAAFGQNLSVSLSRPLVYCIPAPFFRFERLSRSPEPWNHRRLSSP